MSCPSDQGTPQNKSIDETFDKTDKTNDFREKTRNLNIKKDMSPHFNSKNKEEVDLSTRE